MKTNKTIVNDGINNRLCIQFSDKQVLSKYQVGVLTKMKEDFLLPFSTDPNTEQPVLYYTVSSRMDMINTIESVGSMLDTVHYLTQNQVIEFLQEVSFLLMNKVY